MPKKKHPPPTPTLQAAILCDQAIQEAATGKWSLIGLFNGIRAGSLPTLHAQLSVYFCVSGAIGEYRFAVELAHLNADQIIGRATGSLEVLDKLAPAELAITLRGIPFRQEGRYTFRLLMNDELIGDKPFEITTPPVQLGGST